MPREDSPIPTLSLATLALGASGAGFLLLCRVSAQPLPWAAQAGLAIGMVGALLVLGLIATFLTRGQRPPGALTIATLVAAAAVFVSAMAYQFVEFLRLPVDLLSFSESPFINDILKWRSGLPVYTAPTDNNSYPYTPGAPILTYTIATLFGQGDSIPFLRMVQFSYVVLASVVAMCITDVLARLMLPATAYRHRGLWLTFGVLFALLAATDSRFNPYVHSLHNDGLALLLSACAYWTMARHALTRRAWLVIAMAVLPALGFLVKQNQLMWAGAGFFYLVAIGRVPVRQLVLYLVVSGVAIGTAVGLCYWQWGDNFIWWVFVGLGSKEVALSRSVLHLLEAGAYGSMALFAAYVLVLRDVTRPAVVLWLTWACIFALEVYTSGVAWVTNHLGPGVLLAGCWFVVAMVAVWPQAGSRGDWRAPLRQATAAAMAVLWLAALGFVREPRHPIPRDFARYVSEIEREFEGQPSSRILMDLGTWIYYRENVLMKDRSGPVSLHAGKNQPDINRAELADTIARIERRAYDKILARQIDTDQSAYDFQDRGSGVKTAILANYHEVGRIAAVRGITAWWPLHMVSEIIVLERNAD